MNHGGEAIIPFNRFLIIANILLWGLVMPWWSTLLVALPVAVFLWRIGSDEYGGMQLVLLINPAWLTGTMSLSRVLNHPQAVGKEISTWRLVLMFFVTILGFLVVFVGILVVVTMLCIGASWVHGRWSGHRPSEGEG